MEKVCQVLVRYIWKCQYILEALVKTNATTGHNTEYYTDMVSIFTISVV